MEYLVLTAEIQQISIYTIPKAKYRRTCCGNTVNASDVTLKSAFNYWRPLGKRLERIRDLYYGCQFDAKT